VAQLVALVRDVSPSLVECELSFLAREPIDVGLAIHQHEQYCQLLASLGVRLVKVPPEPNLPDAVFVEDTAVVVDEVAVATRPGAATRQSEVASVASALAEFRTVVTMDGTGTLDGGDVLHVGRRLVVGRTARSSADGIEELASILSPYGYQVTPARVDGCLHYKSGCSYIGHDTILANRDWVDVEAADGLTVLDVAGDEPWAANTLLVGDVVAMAAGFPRTQAMLESRGFRVVVLDISEIQKAEGGLSCMSVLLTSGPDA
jgi:dimethylargininase